MNRLDFNYLKENNFMMLTPNGDAFVSKVSFNGEDDGKVFKDERQLAIIKAQFGKGLEAVEDMEVYVTAVSEVEFDVRLVWTSKCGDGSSKAHTSSISGEDLYNLVSQAIVLSEENDLQFKGEN